MWCSPQKLYERLSNNYSLNFKNVVFNHSRIKLEIIDMKKSGGGEKQIRKIWIINGQRGNHMGN